MRQAWTPKQQQQILEEYRQTRIAICPIDHMPLDLTDGGPGNPAAVTFTCSTCGNGFASNQVASSSDESST